MWSKFIFVYLHMHLCNGGEHFSPLKDDILFNINWPGPALNLNNIGPPGTEYNLEDSFVMTSANNERFRCTVPTMASVDADRQQKDFTNSKGAHELLAPVFKTGSCAYRVDTFWTYEICHGVHIRQYHEERVRQSGKKDASNKIVLKTGDGKNLVLESEDEKNDLIKTTEFYLGYMGDKIDAEGLLINLGKIPLTPGEVPRKKINGVSTTYYAVNMTDGTPCDLKSNTKRKSTVLYVCGPYARNELISVTETSSCEYELVVLTPVLCKHPLYNVKGDEVHSVQCVALDHNVPKPSALVKQLAEQAKDPSHTSHRATSTTADEDDQPKRDDYRRVQQTTISSLVDQSLLSEFLSGSYCLRGGTSWWRFEFCYGKHVTQYHDDKKVGRTTILVGSWNEDEHREWAKNKVTKVHSKEAKESVIQVAHFYGHGDVCDETGKEREVVVRMKCNRKATSPHSVTIYLLEPRTCSYILGVESLIFCDLLDSADEVGLLSLKP